MQDPQRLFLQNTIAREASITGLGIHTGQSIELRILPATPNTGIRFRRVDSGNVEIPALAQHVSSLELATTLGRDDVTVSTVEHLMAAFHVLGIDNAIVELNGPEVPILDGSAEPYLLLLQAAGIAEQDAHRRVIAITEPLVVQVDDKVLRAQPYPGLRIDYTIEFAKSPIGRQSIDLEIDTTSFRRELAGARTFALLRDVEKMREMGLGLGGEADNCVVFDEQGPVNTELRYDNEPVRHKALDAVGDLALLGCPIWGHLEIEKGGHLLHFRFLEALLENTHAWTWMRADAPPQSQTAMELLEARQAQQPY